MVYHVSVHLASNEWGNNLMYQIAQETFDKFADKQPLMVTVYEHAGWFLVFAMNDNNEIVTIGSANDSAVYIGEVQRLRNKYSSMPHSYLPSIRRE